MINQFRNLFFSGIAGSGMSAIASFMADRGCRVSGSDRAFDLMPHHPQIPVLEAKGITIVPQDGNGPDRSHDCIIFSTAVEHDRPEAVTARSLGLNIMTRPVFLALLTSSFRTIAVAGTSGKSTTAGMLAFLMERAGLSPNFIGGGRVRQFSTGTNPGNAITGNSDYLVIEACESDGSIVNYHPEHTILLNLALDHHSVDITKGMFQTLANNTPGMLVINRDDPLLAITHRKTVAFALNQQSDFQPSAIVLEPFHTDFMLQGQNIHLSLPGRHNLYNALACIAVMSGLGVPLKDLTGHFAEFQGIDRRFDVHLNNGSHIVIDDYAHNPHKIAALMHTVRNIREQVCYIFQPHGFGPTRLMKDEYIRVFSEHLRPSDHLILLPIFYAGGTAARDISSADLAIGIAANGKSVEVIDHREDIINRIDRFNSYIVLGARDDSLSMLAGDIAGALIV